MAHPITTGQWGKLVFQDMSEKRYGLVNRLNKKHIRNYKRPVKNGLSWLEVYGQVDDPYGVYNER